VTAPRDRAANRKSRQDKRSKKNGPILPLVQDHVPRNRVKPMEVEILPRTKAQELYDVAIASKKLVFGIGPAGTGKTWLAAMRAAEALHDKQIKRIIVTRPALEAGESLGFLPGELEEKYEPYFRPVRDALEEFFGTGHLEYLLKSGAIEARPLGLLRGSTIKDAWLLGDEMQNATKTQMKMLLSRIGDNCKFLINGDPDQCDLPNSGSSGLMDAVARLGNHPAIGTVSFAYDDIVRSGLCRDIVLAYADRLDLERYNSQDSAGNNVGVLRTLRVA